MRKRILGMAVAALIALALLAGLPGAALGQETPVTATLLPTNTNTPVPATATSAPATATSAPATATSAPTTAVPAVAITAVPAVTATPTAAPLELPVTGQSNTTRALLGLVPVAILLLLALPAMGRLRARRR